jgi:hypothetical protein
MTLVPSHGRSFDYRVFFRFPLLSFPLSPTILFPFVKRN